MAAVPSGLSSARQPSAVSRQPSARQVADGDANRRNLERGMPEGTLGRISNAIAPTNGDHVYAQIHAKKGVLNESKDLGEKWEKLSETRLINSDGLAEPYEVFRMAG